jgi:hypothetical protein
MVNERPRVADGERAPERPLRGRVAMSTLFGRESELIEQYLGNGMLSVNIQWS